MSSLSKAPSQNKSPRPVDLRIQLGDYFEFPFRERVLDSESNTTAAIYLLRSHVEEIAAAYDINPSGKTKRDLYDAIRSAIGRPPQDGKPFSQDDLLALVYDLGLTPRREPALVTELYDLSGAPVGGKHLYTLLEAAYVDVILGGNDGRRMFWPSRIQPVHEATGSYRDACSEYIVDSSFKDESISNADALDTAADLGADAVVLADIWHDMKATVDALVDGVAHFESHEYDGEVILPLQPPFGECADRLLEHGISDFAFAIGGLKNENTDQPKISAAREVRAVIGDDAHLHGLGFGLTPPLATAIRDDPDLLDSLDYSTPIRDFDTSVKAGDERLSVVAAQASSRLIEDVRLVTPFAQDATTQQHLGAFGDD